MGRKLSGLETIIDIVYLVAAHDDTTEVGRAGLNLMDSVGRIEGVQAKRLDEWVKGMAHAVVRAVDEGDILEGLNPEDVARLIISTYTGTRLTTELNNSEQFLRNMEKNWNFILPGFTRPDRTSTSPSSSGAEPLRRSRTGDRRTVGRQARAQATRGKIIDAAVELFDENGFAATGLGDIIEQAEITKGALYYHFDSKESLATAIIEETTDRVIGAYRGSPRRRRPHWRT